MRHPKHTLIIIQFSKVENDVFASPAAAAAVEKVIGSKLVGAGPTLHCWSNRPAAVVPWPQVRPQLPLVSDLLISILICPGWRG